MGQRAIGACWAGLVVAMSAVAPVAHADPPPADSSKPATGTAPAPAPSATPPQYPPAQYPPGQYPPQYPPAQYPQYPPGQYPPQYPPGQYPPGQYPPGYGYPPPYYAPPPGYPAQPYAYTPPPPKPMLPEDAAVRGSPFVDLFVGAYDLQDRYSDFMSVGGEFGAYLVKRIRVAGRIIFPLESLHDESGASPPFGEQTLNSDSPVFLYSASLGVVATSSRSFVLSPGVTFLRANVSDYGTFVGVSLPFEWVTASGLRLGTEVNIGRALGGVQRLECIGLAPGQGGCVAGSTRTIARPAGTAFVFDFLFGWGFGHPDPVMPK